MGQDVQRDAKRPHAPTYATMNSLPPSSSLDSSRNGGRRRVHQEAPGVAAVARESTRVSMNFDTGQTTRNSLERFRSRTRHPHTRAHYPASSSLSARRTPIA